MWGWTIIIRANKAVKHNWTEGEDIVCAISGREDGKILLEVTRGKAEPSLDVQEETALMAEETTHQKPWVRSLLSGASSRPLRLELRYQGKIKGWGWRRTCRWCGSLLALPIVPCCLGATGVSEQEDDRLCWLLREWGVWGSEQKQGTSWEAMGSRWEVMATWKGVWMKKVMRSGQIRPPFRRCGQ